MLHPVTYQTYEEYSTKYIINLEPLDSYIKTLHNPIDKGIEIEQWLEANCYYIIPSILVPEFSTKLHHNLGLAKQHNDPNYLQYISKKLSIDVDQDTWEYIPRKIKIKLKTSKIQSGFIIPSGLATLLSFPTDNPPVFKYKSEILRVIHQYIYQNRLQNRYDRKVVTPDDALQAHLLPLKGELEYTYENLHKYVPFSAVQ